VLDLVLFQNANLRGGFLLVEVRLTGFNEYGCCMKRSIEMRMLKLADEARIVRLSDPDSGLCVENAAQAKHVK
jgi:hypothetical protein